MLRLCVFDKEDVEGGGRLRHAPRPMPAPALHARSLTPVRWVQQQQTHLGEGWGEGYVLGSEEDTSLSMVFLLSVPNPPELES